MSCLDPLVVPLAGALWPGAVLGSGQAGFWRLAGGRPLISKHIRPWFESARVADLPFSPQFWTVREGLLPKHGHKKGTMRVGAEALFGVVVWVGRNIPIPYVPYCENY